MAIRPLHSLHLIKDPVRDSPRPQHEPDAKNYSAAPLRQASVFETLAAAHRAQWRGFVLARLLHRNLHALHSMTREHVTLVSQTQRLRAHYLRQVFWLQVTARARLSWSKTLLHFKQSH
jgi:hypothetical protein